MIHLLILASLLNALLSTIMGLAVLLGEFYILSKGHRFIKTNVQRIAAKKGIACKVVLRRTQSIAYKHPTRITLKKKMGLEILLFLHILGLIFLGLLWLGLVVGIATVLF